MVWCPHRLANFCPVSDFLRALTLSASYFLLNGLEVLQRFPQSTRNLLITMRLNKETCDACTLGIPTATYQIAMHAPNVGL